MDSQQDVPGGAACRCAARRHSALESCARCEFPHRRLLTQPASDLCLGSCGSRFHNPSSHDGPPHLMVGRRDQCNLLSCPQSMQQQKVESLAAAHPRRARSQSAGVAEQLLDRVETYNVNAERCGGAGLSPHLSSGRITSCIILL